MPYKVNPTTGKLDYYEVSNSVTSFEKNYGLLDWESNTLTVEHFLNTLSPDVSVYEQGELLTFAIDVINENKIVIIKNEGSPTPQYLKVGVNK
jgi:hypothetical protein